MNKNKNKRNKNILKVRQKISLKGESLILKEEKGKGNKR